MSFLEEAINDLGKKDHERKIKVTRLDEAALPGYDVKGHGLDLAQRVAANIVREATRVLYNEWRENDGVRRHWSKRKDFVEDTIRDLSEELAKAMNKVLDDEIDVALSHMHGI